MVRLQKNAIAAARGSGVRHVVKLSALAEAGVAWTVFRPHVFMQNLLDQAELLELLRTKGLA
jgi:hypothetical protein